MKSKKPLNLIFAGTPAFSAVTLQALLHSSHSVKAVYTQPDRPAGRGRKLTASPVKELAVKHGIPVYQPLSLCQADEQQKLVNLNADLMIVVAYGLILPLPVLTAPTLGCLNVHASLLPRWRGAAPIQRAILAGDTETGITIMQMDEGLDTGDMLYKLNCPIFPTDTTEKLHDRLAVLGADALMQALEKLSELVPESQNNQLATYAHKIKKEEAKLDWQLPAKLLSYQVRAFNPWPVAFSGDLRVWEADALSQVTHDKPGTILNVSAEGVDIATGQGVLRLLKLQWPGGKVISAADAFNAKKAVLPIGTVLP